MDREPLTVRHNDANGQKYITIPSTSTDKPHSQITPGDKIIPLCFSSQFCNVPGYLDAYNILGKVSELLFFAESRLSDHEERTEETGWIFEELAELQHRLSEFRDSLDDHYKILAEPGEEPPIGKAQIETDRKAIVEKYDELADWEQEQLTQLREDYPKIEAVESKENGTHVLVTYDGSEYYLDNAADHVPEETPEEVVEFVRQRNELLGEREARFVQWMEEKGYEPDANRGGMLPFNRFTLHDWVIRVPYCVSDPDNIEVWKEGERGAS